MGLIARRGKGENVSFCQRLWKKRTGDEGPDPRLLEKKKGKKKRRPPALERKEGEGTDVSKEEENSLISPRLTEETRIMDQRVQT